MTKIEGMVFKDSIADKFSNCEFHNCIININDAVQISTNECITCNATDDQLAKLYKELMYAHEHVYSGHKVISIRPVCETANCINPRHMEFKVKVGKIIGYQYGNDRSDNI